MITMSIHLFMFSQNRREGGISSSSVAGVDYSDNSDGSFTEGISDSNSCDSYHGGRNSGNDSSSTDGDTKDDDHHRAIVDLHEGICK